MAHNCRYELRKFRTIKNRTVRPSRVGETFSCSCGKQFICKKFCDTRMWKAASAYSKNMWTDSGMRTRPQLEEVR